MISNDLKIHLYPCCKIVEGATKDAIYDLQREAYYLIPHSLTMVLKECKGKTWAQVMQKYSFESETLEEYRAFLQKYDLCYSSDCNDVEIIDIENIYETPDIISNAIIDIDKCSSFDIENILLQLDELACENLEIRFFDEFALFYIKGMLEFVKGTSIRDLELLIKYTNEISIECLLNLHFSQARIRKITIYNSPGSKVGIYNHEEITLIFIADNISDETCCGVINQWYLLPKTELYLESLNYNTCLHKKIAVDKRGNIKNCPSMEKSYGSIVDTMLIDVVTSFDFKKVWYIKKDDIEICKDCELRHMCQDCRAFISDENNILSKPSKCSYNPYI